MGMMMTMMTMMTAVPNFETFPGAKRADMTGSHMVERRADMDMDTDTTKMTTTMMTMTMTTIMTTMMMTMTGSHLLESMVEKRAVVIKAFHTELRSRMTAMIKALIQL